MKIELLGGSYDGQTVHLNELPPDRRGPAPYPNSVVMDNTGEIYILHSRSEKGHLQYRYKDMPHFADGGYSSTPPDSHEPAAQVSAGVIYIDGKEVVGVHNVQAPTPDNDN